MEKKPSRVWSSSARKSFVLIPDRNVVLIAPKVLSVTIPAFPNTKTAFWFLRVGELHIPNTQFEYPPAEYRD